MVDHLVLKDRRAQLLLHLRVLLHELEELALLPRILAGSGQNCLRHLSVGHLHLCLATDLGQQEAKANPANRKGPVFVRRLDIAMGVAMIVRMLFVVKLMGDLPGLGVNEIGRQVELDHPVQLVQQRSLHDGARGALVFGLQTLGDLALQRGQVLGAELLGHLVVDLRRLRLFHRLHRAGEKGGLAGQMGGTISLGEGHVDRDLIADLRANQVRFKARNERVRSQHQRVILTRAALEQLAVDQALEVDHDLVAILGLGTPLAIVEGLGLPGQVLQRFGHGLLVGLHDQAVKLDLAGINLRDRGQHVVADVYHNVLTFFPGLAALHLHLGLQRRTVASLVEVLLHRTVDGFLHCVAKKAGTKLLFQNCQRDLAFAEPLDLDVRLRF